MWLIYGCFLDDGDVVVVDKPPEGVVQSGLESHLLPDQDPDAEQGQQAGQGEGDQQGQQGHVATQPPASLVVKATGRLVGGRTTLGPEH